MNNLEVEKILESCDNELNRIENILNELGGTHEITPFINKYSVIKSCGTIEVSYKALIADFCTLNGISQIKKFINTKVRKNSSNPKYRTIVNMLAEFDENWSSNFKNKMQADSNYDRIIMSIDSLVSARNEFAHGGNPSISFNDVKNYFSDAKFVIHTLDKIIQ